MHRTKCFIGVAFLAAFFLALVAPSNVTAQGRNAGNVSQYIVAKAAGTSPAVRVFNPTPFDQYVLVIVWNEPGTFRDCEGEFIPAFGTDPESDFDTSFSGDGLLQIISAVPTGKNMGRMSGSFGVFARIRKHTWGLWQNPKKFRLHSDPQERAAMIAACCTEMVTEDGQSGMLFKKFDGFVCP